MMFVCARSPLSAPVFGSVKSESRMGELRFALGQKLACCVPLFCMTMTSLGAGGPGAAARSLANAAVAGIAASARRACRRPKERRGMGAIPSLSGDGGFEGARHENGVVHDRLQDVGHRSVDSEAGAKRPEVVAWRLHLPHGVPIGLLGEALERAI